MLPCREELHRPVLGVEHCAGPMPCWDETSSWKVTVTGEHLNGFALEDTNFLMVSCRFELFEREKIPEF